MALTPAAALQYLSRSHERDRLGHAYLISGPPGSGKKQLAAELAHALNGISPGTVFNDNTASVYVAEPQSKSRKIVIEQIRGLEHFLQLRSDSVRKLAILIDADRMQPQAANAFLKTLEEPPRGSLLLLLTTLPEALPDTIVSRCLGLPLAAPAERRLSEEEQALVALLEEATREPGRSVQGAYALGQGFQRLLGGIRQNIQDENAAALKRDETRYKNTTDGAWLDEREDYYKALSESAYIAQRARLVEVLFAWWSDVLRVRSGVDRRELEEARSATERLAQTMEIPAILRRIRRLEELRDHLGRNIQEALALETAFLRVFAAD